MILVLFRSIGATCFQALPPCCFEQRSSCSSLLMSLPLNPRSERPIIAPSVAKANFLSLGSDLRAAVDGGAEWLHFSIQDGRMVPKISFGPLIVSACRKEFPNTIFDVKLGIFEPERRIADFVKAGADVISVRHCQNDHRVAFQSLAMLHAWSHDG